MHISVISRLIRVLSVCVVFGPLHSFCSRAESCYVVVRGAFLTFIEPIHLLHFRVDASPFPSLHHSHYPSFRIWNYRPNRNKCDLGPRNPESDHIVLHPIVV